MRPNNTDNYEFPQTLILNIQLLLPQDQKKIQNILTDRELLYNPKPSNRSVTNLRKTIGYGPNLNRSGSMTPSFSGRISAGGGCTPELLTPRSYSGHTRTYFSGRTSQLSATKLNVSYGSTQAESMSFTSISGSELGSPRLYWAYWWRFIFFS